MEVNTYESCTGTVQLDQLPVLNLIMYSDAGTQSSVVVVIINGRGQTYGVITPR
jgi:hypothetical protein